MAASYPPQGGLTDIGASSTRSPRFPPQGLAAPPAPDGPLMDDMEAWWELDGTDLENKADPGTHDLTDLNTVGSRTGVGGVGSAADFIAANSESYLFDRVEFADATDWSIAYWAFHDVSGSGSDGAEFSDDQTGGHYSYMYWDGASGNALMYNCDQKRSWAFQGLSGGAAWHHYAWINDDALAGNLKLYVDGANVRQPPGWGATGLEFASNSTPSGVSCFGLRNLGREQAQARYLDGGLQWFGMWSRVLTDAEVVALYNGGAGLGWPFGY